MLASDPLVGEGTVAYLRACPGVTPLSPDSIDRADVVLVMADQLPEETLSLMERAAGRVPDREIRFGARIDGLSVAGVGNLARLIDPMRTGGTLDLSGRRLETGFELTALLGIRRQFVERRPAQRPL